MPWNKDGSEEWASPEPWDQLYTNTLRFTEGSAYESRVNGGVKGLCLDLGRFEHWGIETVLEAGCGLGLAPHLLAHWGYKVTATDISPVAIQFLKSRIVSESELAKTMVMLVPFEPDHPGYGLGGHYYVMDHDTKLAFLRARQRPGGSLQFLKLDWRSPELPKAHFDLIHSRNGLRCATEDFFRETIASFEALLAPGGLLFLENTNAWDIKFGKAQALIDEFSFEQIEHFMGATKDIRPIEFERDRTKKYILQRWPTG